MRGNSGRIRLAATAFVLLMAPGAFAGRTIYVDDDGPADFNNIQVAIDDADDGDVVVVKPGTYTGDGNRDIDFHGKAITVRSTEPNNVNIVAATIIDCNGTEVEPHCGFYFHSHEDANSLGAGFTITKGCGHMKKFGDAMWSFGGGIYCEQSGPTISNCAIANNKAIQGAGIFAWKNSSPKIVGCTVSSNIPLRGGGGGIYCWENTAANIINCLICENAGRGIYCWDSPLVYITNCTITSNEYEGVIISGNGSFTVEGCVISNNRSEGIRASLYETGSAMISNCVISGNNNPVTSGGGIRLFVLDDASVIIANCTITGNSAVSRFDIISPGGIACCSVANAFVTNTVIWNNVGGDVHLFNLAPPPDDIWFEKPSQLMLSYCCVGEASVEPDPYVGDPVLLWGDGNMNSDPCFASSGYWDPNGTPDTANDDFWVDGDYHLKSQAGRWDPETQSWVKDDVTSPCIDAGDPNSPVGLEPFPNGGIINMGVYGGTAEASKSYFGEPVCETIVAGDINGDCRVDFEDFRILALHWLQDENR